MEVGDVREVGEVEYVGDAGEGEMWETLAIKLVITTSKPVITSSKLVIATSKLVITTKNIKLVIATSKPVITTSKLVITTSKLTQRKRYQDMKKPNYLKLHVADPPHAQETHVGTWISIVCAISRGSVAGVPFGNNYAPDISNFELHQRLRLLEDLQVKAAEESMVMRKTVDTYQNMLGKVFTDLTTLNYEFGKLQNENQLLHSRLDYVMMKNNDLLTLCGKKCMDPENLDHFRDTENKLESDHTTDRNDSYPFVSTPVESHVDPNTYKLTKPLHSNPKHVIRQSPVPILGAKRVSEDIGMEIMVTNISPSTGGTNGGTKITLLGSGFSGNAPNLGQGSPNENKVWFKGMQTYACDVSADMCTSTMIICTTRNLPELTFIGIFGLTFHDLDTGSASYFCEVRPLQCDLVRPIPMQGSTSMKQGTYIVGLSVDGFMVSTNRICNNTQCPYQTTARNTPLFTSFSPRTGPPDTLITFKGRIFTSQYDINPIASTNGLDVRILRVFLGEDQCQMKDDSGKLKEEILCGSSQHSRNSLLLKSEQPEFSVAQVSTAEILYSSGQNSRNSLWLHATKHLYGLELDSEDAYTGTLTCKAVNINIDNLGFSMIVDGRSRIHPDLTWLTVNNQLAVFQMYPYVASISPSVGSVIGGTLITVNGRGFAKDATSVLVGELECKDINVRSTTELTCVTPEKPRHDEEHLYAGSRGGLCETWDLIKSFADLADVRSLSDNDVGYQNTTLEDSYYSSTSSDSFVVRISGFIVAPFTARFRMMLKGCGGARLFFRNIDGMMKEIASSQDYTTMVECESYYNNGHQDKQISDIVELQEKKFYYYEIVHRHVDESSFVQWGMFTEDTPPFSGVNDADTGALKMEEHQLHFSKAVVKEKQELTFEKLLDSDDEYTAEVQEIKIENPQAGKTYRLKMFDTITGVIDSTATANVIQRAIQSIPVFMEEDVVKVTVTSVPNSPIYRVTLDSKIGDLPSLEPVNVMTPLKVTVEEKTKGQSGRDTLVLTIGHSITPPLVPGPTSADDIKAKLEIGIGARCPHFLTKNIFTIYSEDYENSPSLMNLGGNIVGNIEPYCGRYCLKNAKYLYYKSASRARPVGDNKVRQLWTYRCVQLSKLLDETSVCRQTNSSLTAISFTSPVQDYYIDVVNLGSKFTSTDSPDMIWKQRMSPTMPSGEMIASVDVKRLPTEDQELSSFVVSIMMYSCGHTVPLIKPYGGQAISNNIFDVVSKSGNNLRVSVNRLQSATKPIDGTVTLRVHSKEKKVPVSWSMDESSVTDYLEIINLEAMGSLKVIKEGECADFTWTYKFMSKLGKQNLLEVSPPCERVSWTDKFMSKLGKQNLLEVVETNPVGGPFNLEVKRKRTGRIEYDPCTPDQLRTSHLKPQVSVMVNSILSACSGNCQFEWTDDVTPTVTSISPLQGREGELLTIKGTHFSVLTGDNTITVGDVDCPLNCAASSSSCSTTQLVCSLGNGSPLSGNVIVRVVGKGNAITTTIPKFTYMSSIDSFTPLKGSTAGGTLLTFTGYGIPRNVSVMIGSANCPIEPLVTTSQFTCRTPAQASGNKNVYVTIGEKQDSSLQQFTYDSSSSVTPVVKTRTLSVLHPSVLGGESVNFTGIGFKHGVCTKLVLVKLVSHGQSASDISTDLHVVSDTEAKALMPGTEPGVYTIKIQCQHGFALNENNLQIEYQFAITAVHPPVGSVYGGTRVTFKGVGFGDDPSKLTTTIGSHACVIDPVTFSSTEFMCQVTRTGKTHTVTNNGYSAKLGTGYNWHPRNGQYYIGDTIRWSFKTSKDEFKMGVYELRNGTGTEEMLHGFNSGVPVHQGSYKTDLSKAGVFYFWSRYLDQDVVDSPTISFRAQFRVSEKTASSVPITVTIGEKTKYTALHIVDSGETIDCGDCELSVPDCIPPVPSSTRLFHFSFLPCLGAVITSVSPTVATDNDDITIKTSLPGNQLCHNEVTMGTKICRVHRQMEGGFVCRIDPGTDMVVGQSEPITIRIKELGYSVLALPNPNFQLRSRVISARPEQGSVAGGTTLVISGVGLSGGTPMVGGVECEILEESFTEVKCRTPPMSSSADRNGDTRRAVQFIHNDSPDGVLSPQLSFRYMHAVKLTSVSPKEVFGLTTIFLGGHGFGTEINKVHVTLGEERIRCAVKSVKDNIVTCEIACLTAEPHLVEVNIDFIGAAQSDTPFWIVGRPAVSAVSPQSGSIYGGVLVGVAGNAFYDDATTVTIGGKDCLVSGTVSTCQLVCELPPTDDVAGSQPVAVTLGSTFVIGSTIQFAYNLDKTPVISGVDPVEGTAGQEITIEGEFFYAESREVYVGGSICAVQIESAEIIVCKLGDHAAGLTDVVVIVPGYGRSAPEGETSMFTYLLIVDKQLNPKIGPPSGGQKVTMSGAGFNPDATTVFFGNSECDILTELSSSTRLVFLAPPGSGCVDVEIDQDNLHQVITDGYKYDDPAADPVIENVTPQSAGTAGGTRVTITGSNFGDDADKVKVDTAGVVCVVQSPIQDTSVICVTNSSGGTRRSGAVSMLINSKPAQLSPFAQDDVLEFQFVDKYSSSFTWGGSSPPIAGDIVVVSSEMTLMIDVEEVPVLTMLVIDGGTVIFDETKSSILLQAHNILIINQGKLQVGTEDKPYTSYLTILLHGHYLEQTLLPLYGSKVIAVREGTLDLHGIPRSPWSKLAATAAKGDTHIVLIDPVNWRSGDLIVIATTGNKASQEQTETRMIEDISDDGYTLTFVEPLQFEHLGITLRHGDHDFEVRAEVGLLSHNVKVMGTNTDAVPEKAEACQKGLDSGEFATEMCYNRRFGKETSSDQFGAQIFVHAAEPDNDMVIVRINNTEITQAGQTFGNGRHPIHFHMNGDVSKSYVHSSAIHGTFNRALNIRTTNNLLVGNNVFYNVTGCGIFLEDGTEMGNQMQNNLAFLVKPSPSLHSEDLTPAAFFITNPDNIIQDNVAAGGTHFGFWYNFDKHSDGMSRNDNFKPKNGPFRKFYGNTAHSMGEYGLWVLHEYYPSNEGFDETPSVALFEEFTAYLCKKAAEMTDVSALLIENLYSLHNELTSVEIQIMSDHHSGDIFQDHTGLKAGVYVAYDPMLPLHPKWDVGDGSAAITTYGVVFPCGKVGKVDGVTFVNYDTLGSSAFSFPTKTSTCYADCAGYHYRVTQAVFINTVQRVLFPSDRSGIIEDDGSLTDSNEPGKLVVCSPPFLSVCTKDFSSKNLFNSGNMEVCLCPAETVFHRLTLNVDSISTKAGKRLKATYMGGSFFSLYSPKCQAQKQGWTMLLMENKNEILLEFEEPNHLNNISYSGMVYDLHQDPEDTVNFLILCHKMKAKPDKFFYNGKIECPESTSALTPSDKDGTWYFHEDTKRLCYIVSSLRDEPVRTSSLVNSNDHQIMLDTYKCKYDGCVTPDRRNISPSCHPDSTHVIKTWKQFCNELTTPKKCGDGANVEIKAGVWVTMGTTSTARLNKLIIRGTLTVQNKADVEIVIRATYIVIIGGQLIIGCDDAFVGKATLLLLGSRRTPVYTDHHESGADIPIGAKVLASFGGLTLNGTGPKIPWTTLGNSAAVGDTFVTLAIRVTDWQVNDEVLITATGYNAKEAEKRRIKSVSNKGETTVLELDAGLMYSHTVGAETFNGTSYSIAAEIGDLTRNIKIVGEDYNNIMKESFGGRVIVGTWEDTDTGDILQGYARVWNTEFYHTGQESWTKSHDPRFSIAYKDTGPAGVPATPSSIKYCAFHDGFNTAIGLFGAPDFLVENNIIYHTVGASIQTKSSNTMLYYNLVSLMLWRGTYGNRNDTKLMDYTGAVESYTEIDLVMVGNHISSSERSCLNVFPHPCDSDVVTWSDNVVHTCLIGVALFPTNEGQPTGVDCVRYTGITSYKNWDYGMFYVGAASVEFDGVTLLDNGVGIWGMVHSPSALSHQIIDKYLMVNNSLVVLRSRNFDCKNDVIDGTDKSYLLSRNIGRSFRIESIGYTGITTGSFTSSHNQGPVLPLLDSTSYNSIGGRTVIKGTTFANLNKCPNSEDRAISTSPNTDDLIHPTLVQNVRVVPRDNRNNDRLLYIHKPRTEQMNPSSCIDMECDGHKKVMIHDKDGSLLGRKGTVLSMSESMYGKDLKRSSGDHKIPKSMLIDQSNGIVVDPWELASERGIIRDPTCVKQYAWQAHMCTHYDYKMVILESMDSDTETRRLSPIALLGETDTSPQVGYLDLINGPKDHGQCFDSTCQKSISTFAVVVATNLSYRLFFSSIPPQWLRLTMLHSENSHKFKIAIYYFKANRIDVFAFGEYIPPKNSYYEGEELMFYLDTCSNRDKYIPTISDDCGSNFYESSTKLLHLIVCGNGNTDIKVSQAVFVHISLPTISLEDLSLKNLVNELAQFIGVESEHVKVREAITESASRHKRSSGTTTYVVQIADQPCNTTSCVSETLTLEAADLVSLASKLVNAFLLGQISDILNVTVNSLRVEEVLPSTTDPTWQTIVDSGNVTTVLNVLDSLQFDTTIIEDTEGNPFQQQPVLHFVDANGDHASILGISAIPWEVTASLKTGAGNSSGCTPTLAGTTTVTFVDGWANFTDLLITCTGTAYMINFEITSPTGTNFSLTSANLTILSRNITAAVASVSSPKYTDEAFNLTVHLKDSVTDAVITDVGWKGHTWTAKVKITQSYEYTGSLTGTENVTFDLITGLAVFNDLVLDTAGIFLFAIEVVSIPADYNFTLEQEEAVDWLAMKSNVTRNSEMSVRYNLDYSVYGTTAFAKATCNNMMAMNSEISLSNCTASQGSVIVSFVLRGTNTTIDDFLAMLCNNISSSLSYTYNGTVVTLDKYLLVGGTEPSNCFPQDAGETDLETTSSILGIILGILLVLVFFLIIGIVIYCIKAKEKRHRLKISQVSQMIDEDIQEPITEKPPGPPGTFLFSPDPTYREDPPDQLFRQDTFMGFQDYFPERQMPPVGNSFRLRPKTPKKFDFSFS
ncbi:fibrocystin-L-like [Ylistrum balloti]|uniref:fibrocystin-L-like n=1 Tax=Ylistrum balloti TaxID=509963 RepID=UPI0029058805|nr:fibrocystin-L-like [Ylistrum balloti]